MVGTRLGAMVGGVDTHADTHTLAVLNTQGRVQFTETFSADHSGYDALVDRLNHCGNVDVIGVEGTNSYGAGLTRFLREHGFTVKEVLRPTRQVRRLNGKSDPVDAIQAARSVLSGDGISEPKDTTTPAESLRFLLVGREALVSSAASLIVTIKSLLVTAPEELRARYRDMSNLKLIAALARSRPLAEGLDVPAVGAAHALRDLARTYQEMNARATRLETQIRDILTTHYPAVLDIYCAGPVSAAQLVVTTGGNPHRVRNEAAFAQLCGVAPIPASSGKTVRHRLNRGGDRRGNQALYRIAVVRLRHDPRTRAYAQKRRAEGKTSMETIRCLKRAIAREAYRALTNPTTTTTSTTARRSELREQRLAHQLSQTDVANALEIPPARISDIETGRRPLPALTQRYKNWLNALDTQ